MPDYTSILRRSISALPDASPEMREAVYQRARAALARQLTAVDPPLSSREIEMQHQELEDAVGRLEADYRPAEQDDPFAAFAQEEEFYDEAPAAAPAYPSEPAEDIDEDADEERPDRDTDRDDDDDDYDEEERSSRTPLFVGLLVVLLAVGGVGAYGYMERDRLLALVGLSGDETSVAAVEPPPVSVVTPGAEAPPAEEPAAAESDKLPDRLINGTDAAADAPPAETAPTEPQAPDAAEAPAEAESADAVPGAEEQTAALQEPGESLVAQRAIYYFQGSEGSPGRATEGTVTWSEISRDTGPAVQAVLRMPEQDVTTTVTIYKNNDTTLPASHLVEVQFSGELTTTPVQRVPALVMKTTEQARGQPLTGAAVPVTDDLFWIALSDEAEQVTRNEQLLRDGSWFDIPILFQDGTRALLTFEKGIPGDRVFETVMSAWTPS